MRNKPIIIIDDDTEDIQLFKEIAMEMRLPNQIITFNNPLSALDFLKNAIINPVCILCDINMPKLDGFQLRTELLNSNSSIKDVPFLFLSTSKISRDIKQANELKAFAYYPKPDTIEGIKQTFYSIMSSLKISPKE